MIVADFGKPVRFREVAAVLVLSAHPGLEAVLREDLVSQVPFPHEGRVVSLGQHLCDGRYAGAQGHVAGGHARRVRPEPREHGGPGRAAYGLAHVGVFEHEAVRRQPVERGGFDLVVSIASQRIRALLVGENVEQVGAFHRFPSRLDLERGVRLNQV